MELGLTKMLDETSDVTLNMFLIRLTLKSRWPEATTPRTWKEKTYVTYCIKSMQCGGVNTLKNWSCLIEPTSSVGAWLRKSPLTQLCSLRCGVMDAACVVAVEATRPTTTSKAFIVSLSGVCKAGMWIAAAAATKYRNKISFYTKEFHSVPAESIYIKRIGRDICLISMKMHYVRRHIAVVCMFACAKPSQIIFSNIHAATL